MRNEKSTTAAMQDAITTLSIHRMQAIIATAMRKEVVYDQDTSLADTILVVILMVEVTIIKVEEDVVGGAGAVVVEAAEAKEVMSAMEVRTEGAITTMMNMSIVPKERSTGR